MNLLCILVSIFCATTTMIDAAKGIDNDVLFTFTGGDYSNYETWRWEKMTHLGFWTDPPAEVRSLASEHSGTYCQHQRVYIEGIHSPPITFRITVQ